MEAIDVFETTAVDVGANRLSCVVMSAARCVPGFPTTAAYGWAWALRYKLSLPPHVGTPGAGSHGGNSTPARALVAGGWKSERTGERGGEK